MCPTRRSRRASEAAKSSMPSPRLWAHRVQSLSLSLSLSLSVSPYLHWSSPSCIWFLARLIFVCVARSNPARTSKCFKFYGQGYGQRVEHQFMWSSCDYPPAGLAWPFMLCTSSCPVSVPLAPQMLSHEICRVYSCTRSQYVLCKCLRVHLCGQESSIVIGRTVPCSVFHLTLAQIAL